MDRKRSVFVAVFLGILIMCNNSLAYSAEEVVGQYFSHIEIGDVKAKFSSSISRYTVSGVYVFGHILSSGTVTDRQVFDWLAEGTHSPGNNGTGEKFDLFSRAGRALVASFTSKMTCSKDPWLDGSAAPCQFVETKHSGSPPGAFPSDLSNVVNGVPFSSILSATQRAELNRQHRIFLASNQKYKPGDPQSPQRFETTAPTIVAPAPNAYMVLGKSKFVIKPGSKLNGTEILVHFIPLDTKPGELEETFARSWPTNVLAQGADIPKDVFGKRAGLWKMRARISAPVQGAWSPDVRFRYVLQSPVFTPPSKGSIERQGPGK
jgi:hypothetical protein